MLEQRSNELEIMDDLKISGPVIAQTLKELNTINRRLGGNQISISAYTKMIKGRSEVLLSDVGCGGGDIMKEMAKFAIKMQVNARFIGVDANPHIIEYAKGNTAEFPEITYQPINIFSEEFRSQQVDIIHCCLFLHHFSSEELVELFGQFKRQARLGVIVNDLHRHPIAYWSIKALTTLFSRSEMVRNDAAISVARGFKKKELVKMLANAGIVNYSLKWKWAFRWELIF